MNKHDLIKAIAEKANLTQTQAAVFLQAFESTVTQALAQGDTVALIGFGSFTVKDRAERTGRNPKTGEEIKIPACKVPVFKAGKALKDALH